MVINRVGPLSSAKIVGLLYAILGVAVGGIFSLVAAIGASEPGLPAGVAQLFGVAAVVVLPILYGGMGFVVTLVLAWLYNGLAQLVGGVEIDLH
jgi:hypothetical protein